MRCNRSGFLELYCWSETLPRRDYTTIGKFCIVQTQEYGNILRQVIQGDDPNLYHLFAINYKTMVKRPVLYNVAIL